jgi:polyisoprenoid-binding protein YceI
MNTAVTTALQSTTPTLWQIDPAHSAAHFSVRHLMISNVRGEFTKLSGSAVINPGDPTKSAVNVTIESASINTREPQRDEHLRSADFFDVANFPTLTFRSKRIEAHGADDFKLTGDLTIHGVTKEVTFDVEGPTPSVKDPWGNVRAGITASAKINRKDYGLLWNTITEAGGLMVGDEVKITIEAELIQQGPAA